MINNWKTYKLSEVTTKIGSGATPRGGKEAYKKFGTSLIRSQNVLDFKFSTNGLAFIDEKQASKLDNVTIEENDVLLNITGDSVARVCSVPKEFLPARVNQHVAIVRADILKLNTVYLKYFLLENTNKNMLLTLASAGATRNALTKTMIEDFRLDLPPLPEQTQIANILSSIDNKIENNLAINKTLEDMAMALYKHWFVDFGPFQEGEFVDSELGLIPKGWEVKSLKDFINLNPRLTIPKSAISSYVEMKVLPTNLMSVSNVARKEFKGGSKFQNDDTLFARITPCLENGKMAFVDFLKDDEIAFGSTEFLVMRAKQGVSKYWVYCLAKDSNFRKFSISTMVGSSGRQRVQNDPFLSFELAKPTSEIFNSFSKTIEPWFSQVRLNTFANQSLTNLRDTLLPKLISGEIRLKEFREEEDAEINSA
jgi:type I restriction enzyme S subunit